LAEIMSSAEECRPLVLSHDELKAQ